MSDNISDIAAFYDQGVEAEDARLEEHQLEYDLTWRYLARYLPLTGSILEIGAGTGRYTLELCRRGYAVTAVDLSAALLERCQQRLKTEQLHSQVQFVVADARDLSAVPTTAFDAVLLMGPLMGRNSTKAKNWMDGSPLRLIAYHIPKNPTRDR